MFTDTYLTLKEPVTATFRDKGSKFIGYVFPCYSVDDFKQNLQSYKDQYHDATHHCWAYRLNYDASVFAMNDDGEPNYTAGKPILGQLVSAQLTNVGAVVIRYFGGTLLGVSGLIHAYKETTRLAIQNAEIIEKQVFDVYHLDFNYANMNEVMKLLKQHQIKIHDLNVQETVECIAFIPVTQVNIIVPKLEKILSVKMMFMQKMQ
jgi:uncharacterized YigZ family protein